MKKRRGGIILIVLGVILAGIVGYSVWNLARRAEPQKVETANVIVALKDIPEQTPLTPELLGIQQTLAAAVPAGALTRREDAVGKMSTIRLYAGEIVLAAMLADTGGKSGVAFTLPRGQVLITVPASDIIATGAVHPGDRVDLLITYTPKPSGNQPSSTSTEAVLPATTQTTMQNLQVLGIGAYPTSSGATNAKVDPAAANLITFAVSHQDALVLKALKDSKDVQMEMVLRPAGDEEIVTTEPVTLQSIVQRYHLSAP